MPSALLPLGGKTLLSPEDFTSLSKLRALEPSTSAASTGLPNNVTCAATAEHSSQHYARSCYSFIMRPWPLTRRSDGLGFFFFPSNSHLALSVLNFLRPFSPSYLSFVHRKGGCAQSLSAKCRGLITLS